LIKAHPILVRHHPEKEEVVCSKSTYFKISTLPDHDISAIVVEVYSKQCLTTFGQQAATMIHLLPWVTFTDAAVMCSFSALAIENPHHKNGQ